MDLAKAGAISVVNSFKFMISGAKLFENSIAGIRIGFASMIELAAKAQIKYNEAMIPKGYDASGKVDPYIEKFKKSKVDVVHVSTCMRAKCESYEEILEELGKHFEVVGYTHGSRNRRRTSHTSHG